MVVTVATVLLPLLLSGGTQGVQGVQQDISLEGRIAQLQQRVEERPRDPDLHFELSKLYEEDVGRYYDDALSEFGLAVENGLGRDVLNKLKDLQWNPKTLMLNEQGISLGNNQQYDKAIEKFEKAIKRNPEYPLLHFNIGMMHRAMGRYDEAISYIQNSIDLDPLSINYHQAVGLILPEEGQFKLNKSGFEFGKGGFELARDEFELSLLSFDKIKIIDPKYTGIYFGIGIAQMGLGKYDEAIEAFDNCISFSPADAVSASNLKNQCIELKR